MSSECTYFNRELGISMDAIAKVHGENVHIYPHDSEMLVWPLRKCACFYEGAELVVKRGDHEGFRCTGAGAEEIFHSWKSGGPVRTLERYVTTRTYSAVALICVFFLAIAGIMYFKVLPWVGEKAASLIPREMEMELGQGLAGRFNENEAAGDRADSLLNAFAGELETGTGYPLKMHVIRSPEINAFAVPGGNIFVYSGILCKMQGHEELVALLGHEISHVEKRHSLKSVCRSAASAFFIAALFGDVSGISAGLLSQADEFRQLQYSRELETEADTEGLRFMHRNGIDGKGMVSLLQLLEKESVKMPRLMKYVSTHPDVVDRLSNVQAQSISPTADADAAKSKKLALLFGELQQAID